MSITQQKKREIVFLVLYSQDIAHEEFSKTIPMLMEQLSVTRRNVLDAQKRAEKIADVRIEIDGRIAQVSHAYELERIQLVEKNILRLGIFELFYDPTIPPK